jgi:hypothetical protein
MLTYRMALLAPGHDYADTLAVALSEVDARHALTRQTEASGQAIVIEFSALNDNEARRTGRTVMARTGLDAVMSARSTCVCSDLGATSGQRHTLCPGHRRAWVRLSLEGVTA